MTYATCVGQAAPAAAMQSPDYADPPPLCSESLLTWGEGAHRCSGPWVYTYYECWREARRERFGVESVTGGGQEERPKRCRLPRFGIERWEQTSHEQSYGARELYFRAEDQSWHNRPDDMDNRLWLDCQKFAASISNRERRSTCISEGKRPKVYSIAPWDRSVTPNIMAVTEGITFEIKTERAVYNERESPLCGTTTVSLPIYRLGRCRSAGLEATNVCGVPEERRYSAPGITLDELPPDDEAWWRRKSGGAHCSSCEDSGSMAARASCLLEQIGKLRADQRPNEDIAILEKRLQVAFELSRGPLPPEVETAAIRLAGRSDLDVLCERKVPEVWAKALHNLDYQQSGIYANALEAVNFCYRLASPHVSTEQAGKYATFCADRLPAVYAACMTREHLSEHCFPREWFVDQIARIFTKALGGSK